VALQVAHKQPRFHKTGDHFCATRTDKGVIFSMWALCDDANNFLVIGQI
jgi:hypothetical protein